MQKKIILIVDDDANIREFFKRAIQNDEYEVICAEDGDSAQEILRTHSRLDVAVIDLMMPYSTGFDLIEYIRTKSQHRKLPVIVFTGLFVPEEMQEKVKKEAFAIMQKGDFDLDEFKKTLNDAVSLNAK